MICNKINSLWTLPNSKAWWCVAPLNSLWTLQSGKASGVVTQWTVNELCIIMIIRLDISCTLLTGSVSISDVLCMRVSVVPFPFSTPNTSIFAQLMFVSKFAITNCKHTLKKTLALQCCVVCCFRKHVLVTHTHTHTHKHWSKSSISLLRLQVLSCMSPQICHKLLEQIALLRY